MTTINQTSESQSSSARRHLETDRGVDQARSRTALMSAFTDGTHYNVGTRNDNMIPAGALVMEDGAGTVVPATTGYTAGRMVWCVLDNTPINGAGLVGLGVMHLGDFRGPVVNAVYGDPLTADAVDAFAAQGGLMHDAESI